MPFSLGASLKKSGLGSSTSTAQKPAPQRKPFGHTSRADVLFGEPEQRINSIKITIAAALLCSFGLSWRLWISSRLFPLCPVSAHFPNVAFPLDYIWFFSLLGLLLAIIAIARPRKLVLIFLVGGGLLSLWDQNRWQPWFYQYFFLLAALGLYAWKEPGAKNRQAALDACRLILVSTYFWSGVQKLNANFVSETWPDIAGGVLRHLPESAKRLPPFAILLIPSLEIVIALGLLSRKFRHLSILLAVGTHIFVLALLISSGENVVVWPWNIAMILFVVTLFWRDESTGARRLFSSRNGFHALVFILFVILPALSFFDVWDSYLSSALYSGNTDQAVIYVSAPVMERLPGAIRPHIWQSSQPIFLDINRWSYADLNVPLYPEPRIYKSVTEWICTYAGDSPDIRLRIKEKSNPLSAARKSEYYDCDHVRSTD